MIIYINYDYTTAGNYFTEKSYKEVLNAIHDKKDAFIHTHCLDFFCFDTDVFDVIIRDKEGNELSRNALLKENNYTEKQIRKEHNIHKMFKAGKFNWQMK